MLLSCGLQPIRVKPTNVVRVIGLLAKIHEHELLSVISHMLTSLEAWCAFRATSVSLRRAAMFFQSWVKYLDISDALELYSKHGSAVPPAVLMCPPATSGIPSGKGDTPVALLFFWKLGHLSAEWVDERQFDHPCASRVIQILVRDGLACPDGKADDIGIEQTRHWNSSLALLNLARGEKGRQTAAACGAPKALVAVIQRAHRTVLDRDVPRRTDASFDEADVVSFLLCQMRAFSRTCTEALSALHALCYGEALVADLGSLTAEQQKASAAARLCAVEALETGFVPAIINVLHAQVLT